MKFKINGKTLSIPAVIILVIALLVSEQSVAIIMAALMGACIGFVPYNKNPAQIK